MQTWPTLITPSNIFSWHTNIFQDPVDLAHITYEYDHSLLEHEEGGTEARRLTQRACIMTLTLGDQQVDTRD